MRKTFALAYFASLLANPLTANAIQVRMDYTGVATLATGIFADETVTLANGYATDGFVSGSFFIDTDFVELGNNSDSQDEYVPDDSPNLNGVWELNVLYGSESHTTANNERNSARDHHSLILHDSFGPDDYFYYLANSLVTGDDRGGIYLAADDLISSGAPSLTGNSLSFAFPGSLAQRLMFLPEQDYQGQYVVLDANNQEIGHLEWGVTGLTATLIPAAQIPLPPSFFRSPVPCFWLAGFWKKSNRPGLYSV